MRRYTLSEVLLGFGLVGMLIFNFALFIWNLYDNRFCLCILNAAGRIIVVIAAFQFNDAVKIRRECDRIRKINDGLRNEIEERLRFRKL